VKVVFAFLIGFAAGYLGFIGYVVKDRGTRTQVLAEAIESTNPPQTETSSPTPAPTPGPTETPTPKPTSKPTHKPTLTPSPSPTATPIPAPTSTPDVWSPPDMEPLFAQYAGQYGVDKNVLERLANCESHFNPNAVSKDYVGMFQFSTSTWVTNRSLMGMDVNPDLRVNIEESIKTAAFVVSQRGTSPWPKCL
jgi:hypothetical protein